MQVKRWIPLLYFTQIHLLNDYRNSIGVKMVQPG